MISTGFSGNLCLVSVLVFWQIIFKKLIFVVFGGGSLRILLVSPWKLVSLHFCSLDHLFIFTSRERHMRSLHQKSGLWHPCWAHCSWKKKCSCLFWPRWDGGRMQLRSWVWFSLCRLLRQVTVFLDWLYFSLALVTPLVRHVNCIILIILFGLCSPIHITQ